MSMDARTRRSFPIVIVVLALLAIAGTLPDAWLDAALPVGAAAAAAPMQLTFRSGIDMVRLDVFVTKDGRPVSGLTSTDFEVLDSGVYQTPEVVANKAGATVLFVLDTSGSLGGKPFAELVEAAQVLNRHLGEGDRVGLVSFASRPQLLVPLDSGRGQLEAIRRALGDLRTSGRTSLNDAVAMGLRALGGTVGGSLMLVFTDGEDNASETLAAHVLEAAKRSETTIAIVASAGALDQEGTMASDILSARQRFLRALAEATGGPLLDIKFGQRRIEEAFLQVITEFNGRYVVSYKPQCIGLNDGWHKIDVRVAPGVGRVRVRSGYYANNPNASAPCWFVPNQGQSAERQATAAGNREAPMANAEAGGMYASLVRQYQTGDREQAIRELAGWSRRRLAADASEKTIPTEVRSLASAALLHAEAALRQQAPEMIREHLTVAQRLVDAWPGGRPDMAFRCTWHLFAESYLRTVSTTDQDRALQRLSEECLDQPEVRLSFGSLWEVTDATQRLDTGSGQGALGVAESHFRAALEGDPNLIEARLRLGRVLYLRNRPDKAIAELEQVRAKAKEHYLVYLAALFLGQIHEQANRREQAGECYRSALKLIPDAPAASASLAHLQGTGGPKRRADWALTEAAKPGGVGIVISRTDPWFLYRFGQYWRALERIDRLRALVASADFGR